MFTRALTLLAALLGLLLGPAPLRAQIGPAQRPTPSRPAPPAPHYHGPGDVVDPHAGGDTEDEDEEEEIDAPGLPVFPIPPPRVITPPSLDGVLVGVPRSKLVVPPAPDPVAWLPWWQYQRWQRLEEQLAGGPARAITPRDGEVRIPLTQPPDAEAKAQVLPALLAAWEAGPEEPELRAALLIALARVGDGTEVGAALRAALQDEDQRVTEAAALGLGILREPHAIPVLAGLLQDGESGARAMARSRVPNRTRAFAAYGLGLIARGMPYGPLRHTIRSALLTGLERHAAPTDDVPAACIQALGLFPGDDAEEVVPEMLRVLREKGRRETVRSQVPPAVAKILARRGEAGALERSTLKLMIQILHGGNQSALVRQGAALALGRLGSHPALAETAAAALAEAAARDNDPRVKHLALLGLAEIGSASHATAQAVALPALMKRCQEGTEVDRSWAALAMGWTAALSRDRGRPLPARVASFLVGLYPETARQRSRAALSLALGLAGAGSAGPTLEAGLPGVGDPVLRAEALAGLALLGDPRHLESVLAELDTIDPFLEAYQAACAGLARHFPDALLRRLQESLDEPAGPFKARFAAAIGLGWIRDARAVAPLLHLLNENDPYFVKAAAARSLGRIAERPGDRWNAPFLDLLNPYTAPATLVGNALSPGVCDRP